MEASGLTARELMKAPTLPSLSIEQLLLRQMELSRALSAQEESAWDMASMMINLQETVSKYEQELSELREEVHDSLKQRMEMSHALEVKEEETRRWVTKCERRDQEILSMQEEIQRLTEESASKDAMLRDRDAVIMIMAQKVNAKSMEKDPQFEASLKVKKARRETKLQEIMSKMRGDKPSTTGDGSHSSKERRPNLDLPEIDGGQTPVLEGYDSVGKTRPSYTEDRGMSKDRLSPGGSTMTEATVLSSSFDDSDNAQ